MGALLGDISSKGEDLGRKPLSYINKEVANPAKPAPVADIARIPMDMIEPNPYQPRMAFDSEAIDELAESIRTFGLIQPITVRRKEGGKYQIISGERRYRASLSAGMEMIPAYIRETDDQGMLEMAIVENIQRENLDPIEEAMSYRRLIDECGLTQEKLGLRLGKKRVSVTNSIRLLKLPAKVQHDLKLGILSVGHAKVLLSVEDAKAQEKLGDWVLKEGASVRQLEEKVRKSQSQTKKRGKKKVELPDDYYRVLTHLGKYFGENISLRKASSGEGGTLTVKFSTDKELKSFLDILEAR